MGRAGEAQEADPFAGIIQIKFAGISQINLPYHAVFSSWRRDSMIQQIKHPDACSVYFTSITG
jgi:hypothetical protein